MRSPTAEIDAAISYAMDDLTAARIAHMRRPGAGSEEYVRRCEDALNGLLERRKEYR